MSRHSDLANKPKPKLKRVLVAPLRFVGDTILTVPLLRGIHQQFPDAKIDVLTNTVCGNLLSVSPYVHQLITENKSRSELMNRFRAEQYDAVLILRKSFTLALLCKLAGIPMIIGYDKQRFPWGYRRWGWLLNQTCRYPSLRTTDYQAASNLQFSDVLRQQFESSESAPIPAVADLTSDTRLELWHTPDDEAHIQTLLSNAGLSENGVLKQPLALVHAVSASHGKAIAPEKFIPVILDLLKNGYAVILTGTSDDIPFYETLMTQVQKSLLASSHTATLFNFAGQTTLRQLVALCKQTDLMITLDSGPLHMAAACGVKKLVGIFGPTNEKQWGVYQPGVEFKAVFKDLPCRPCYAKVCSHNNCRTTISAEDILSALQNVTDFRVVDR